MSTYVLSRSDSFDRHATRMLAGLGGAVLLRAPEQMPRTAGAVLLVHAPSFQAEVGALTEALSKRSGAVVGLGADAPRLPEMLELTALGARAYFNSYMNDVHYQQMLEMLAAGERWLIPTLLAQALDLARTGLDLTSARDGLESLTPREREIAFAVGRGQSNKEIADSFGIAERTAKTHLTRIFKKLGIKSRVTLALALDRGAETTRAVAEH